MELNASADVGGGGIVALNIAFESRSSQCLGSTWRATLAGRYRFGQLGSPGPLVSTSIAVAAEVGGPGHCWDFYHYNQRAGYLPNPNLLCATPAYHTCFLLGFLQPLSGSDVPSLTHQDLKCTESSSLQFLQIHWLVLSPGPSCCGEFLIVRVTTSVC